MNYLATFYDNNLAAFIATPPAERVTATPPQPAVVVAQQRAPEATDDGSDNN